MELLHEGIILQELISHGWRKTLPTPQLVQQPAAGAHTAVRGSRWTGISCQQSAWLYVAYRSIRLLHLGWAWTASCRCAVLVWVHQQW